MRIKPGLTLCQYVRSQQLLVLFGFALEISQATGNQMADVFF